MPCNNAARCILNARKRVYMKEMQADQHCYCCRFSSVRKFFLSFLNFDLKQCRCGNNVFPDSDSRIERQEKNNTTFFSLMLSLRDQGQQYWPAHVTALTGAQNAHASARHGLLRFTRGHDVINASAAKQSKYPSAVSPLFGSNLHCCFLRSAKKHDH